jgi:hypothetical protein
LRRILDAIVDVVLAHKRPVEKPKSADNAARPEAKPANPQDKATKQS